MTHRLSLDRIAEAARIIDPVFINTPQFVCETLSAQLGTRVVVKIETLNPVRCFKGRGADYFATTLSPGEQVVTASSGNLGQALAYACRRRDVRLTVFAATRANPLKVDRMRALGADIRLVGEDFDDAKTAARRFAAAAGLAFVEDGVEPRLSEGAGSIAVELLRFAEQFDDVLVSLGNGAILGGIARWVSAHAPATKVIGVAPAGAPCMAESFRAGRPMMTESIDTIADGMATRTPVPEALADLVGTVTDVVLVDDNALISAMRLAHRHLGLVLEPSGAAGIAAIASYPERFRDRTVGVVLCGGNLTSQQMTMWLGPNETIRT